MYQPSADCFELIKASEGLHRQRSDGQIEAYLDPVKIPTIGYGFTIHLDQQRPITLEDVITRQDCDRWLQLEVTKVARTVQELCTVDLTQGMVDALVSFAYNVGTGQGGFATSTLLKKLNNRDYAGAANEFKRWVHGDGKVLPGLVIRRDREATLFQQDGWLPAEPIPPAPDQPFPVSDWAPPPLPLAIHRTLTHGAIGPDCFLLNCGLAELGYLRLDSQPGEFNSITKGAVCWFQGDRDLEVDGKFGPKSRATLAIALRNARQRVPAPKVDNVYCRLSRTGTYTYSELEQLTLEFISPKGQVLAKLPVISGAPNHQYFRVPEDPASYTGNLEPLPQGHYTIGDIQWAGGKDNYTAVHAHSGNGLGPIFVPLIKNFIDDRDAFGFHMDWNRESAPGSAGCVCPGTLDDLQTLVALLRRYDPRDLFVDWGIR